MMADKGHKPAAFEHLCRKPTIMLFNKLQFLVIRVSHGNDHPAALIQLSEQRLGNLGCSSCDKDGIEGRKFWKSECAVSTMNVDVVVAEPGQLLRRSRSQLWPQLSRKNVLGQVRQDRRLKTASRSDFQRSVSRLQTQGRGHGSNDVRLRNSLTAADRQGGIFVGPRTHLLGYKFVPRDRQHRREDRAIADAATSQLFFDHLRALRGVFVAFKHA